MRLSVLLVDETEERRGLLEEALGAAGHRVVAVVDPLEDLYARVREVCPDLVIVDMASPSRDTLEHMQCISRDMPRPIVLFTRDAHPQTIVAAVKAGVAAYVVDGLTAERVRPVLEVAMARFNQFRAVTEELERAHTALAERKVIERAKGWLMKQRGCGEEEAYRALRKLAMDSNRRLVDVAQGLLHAASLLS